LEVDDLSAPPLLKSASFKLKSGEILGIAGLRGAGRSDLARAIFRLDKVGSGTVSIKGKEVFAGSGWPGQRVSQGFGYLSEDRKTEGLALDLSIGDNVTMTRFSTCSRYGWLNLRQQSQQTGKLINEMGIKAWGPGQRVGVLSGGNQQKVAVARLIHQDADILLLDEPTRGVDIGSKAKLYETIARLADEGRAILMISSYLPELFGMCDRLAVMSRGRLSSARPIAEWTPETVMIAAIGSGENN
jgi:ribose transport system ATP-binding protein